MTSQQPSVVILAGPNGAGKTTASPFVIHDAMDTHEIVNADRIDQNLPRVKIAGNSKAISEALVKAAEYAKQQTMAKSESPSESPL